MKKGIAVVLLLAVALLWAFAPRVSLADAPDSGFREIIMDDCGFIYRDEMLYTDLSVMSTDLAKASMALSHGAYSDDAVTMLGKMGYTATKYNYGHSDLFDNKVAFTLGVRDIPDTNNRIICVAVRGSKGANEWISNFNFVNLFGGDHSGFREAANDVSSILSSYLTNAKNITLWFTGHSRGAAVANLLAHDYASRYRTCAYTFACPNVSQVASPSGSIWNFNNDMDFVPKVPPEFLAYGRYGHDYTISQPSTLTQEHEDLIQDILDHSAGSDDPLDRFSMGCLGLVLSGSSDVLISDLMEGFGNIPILEPVKHLANVTSLTAFESAISSERDEYSEGAQYIREIQALAEDMTDEEFGAYLSSHSEVVSRIYLLSSIQVQIKSDLALALNQTAQLAGGIEAALSALGRVFALAREAADIVAEVIGAHNNELYMERINDLFFGYAAKQRGQTEKIFIPDNITTIGPSCFAGSALKQISMPRVEFIGSEAFSGCGSLETVGLSDTLKGIGTYTFYSCSSLEAIEIPDSVEFLGDVAFAGCSSLKSVTLPVELSILNNRFNYVTTVENIHYTKGRTGIMQDRTTELYDEEASLYRTLEFYSRDSLKNIVLDEGITRIGDYAFLGMAPNVYPGVNETPFTVQLPSTLESIGDYAFDRRKGLTEIVLPAGLTAVGSHAFCSTGVTSVHLPEGITVIPASCFAGCSALTEATLSDRTVIIGGLAFSSCSSLATIGIPDTVTEIGGSAFENCSSLESIVIPDSLETLGESAFYGCSSLKSVTIPVDFTCMRNIFKDVTTVETIHYTKGKTGIMRDRTNSTSGDTMLYYTLEFYSRDSLKNVILGEGITRIGNYAFEGMPPNEYSGVNETPFRVQLPSTLESIGDYAFDRRKGLTEIDLPEGLTSVGSHAFYCTGLTSLQIPAALTTIGNSAFAGCSDLQDIWYRGSAEQWSGMGDASSWSYGASPDLVIHLDTYFITFDANGGTGEMAPLRVADLEPCILPQNVFEYPGFHFAGWQDANGTTYEDQTPLQSVTGDLYLRAVWAVDRRAVILDVYDQSTRTHHAGGRVEYTVSSPSGGEGQSGTCRQLAELELGEGSDLQLTAVADENYFFLGWFEADLSPDGTELLPSYTLISIEPQYRFAVPDSAEYRVCGVFSLTNYTVILPNDLTRIGEEAFAGSSALVVGVPEGCLSIGDGAFRDSALIVILIPGESELGDDVFAGCRLVYVSAHAGSPAQHYCETHDNCIFIELE